MKIDVHCRSAGKQALVTAITAFLARELKLSKSTWTLDVIFKKGLVKNEDMRGSVTEIGGKRLVMVLDSSMDLDRLFNTISHEMVHVKQFARGQYKQTSLRGKVQHYWQGKRVKAHYFQQPWEIEAWSREKLLTNKIYSAIGE